MASGTVQEKSNDRFVLYQRRFRRLAVLLPFGSKFWSAAKMKSQAPPISRKLEGYCQKSRRATLQNGLVPDSRFPLAAILLSGSEINRKASRYHTSVTKKDPFLSHFLHFTALLIITTSREIATMKFSAILTLALALPSVVDGCSYSKNAGRKCKSRSGGNGADEVILGPNLKEW